MPAFIVMILGGLIQITSSLVGRVLVALGLGVATYTGINSSIEWLKGQAVTRLLGLGADAVGVLGLLKVGPFISLIISAMLARALINGVQSDTVKNWVLK